jgi:hypothetical protein
VGRQKNIRIYGKQRKKLDADLMVQILIMLGHEFEKREKQGNAVREIDTSALGSDDLDQAAS